MFKMKEYVTNLLTVMSFNALIAAIRAQKKMSSLTYIIWVMITKSYNYSYITQCLLSTLRVQQCVYIACNREIDYLVPRSRFFQLVKKY